VHNPSSVSPSSNSSSSVSRICAVPVPVPPAFVDIAARLPVAPRVDRIG
jgi:hypothetical protein